MQKAILLLASSVLAVLLASGVAVAVSEQCGGAEKCVGTQEDDKLLGTRRDDWIVGRGGNDTLKGFDAGDYLYGSEGNDWLLGGDSYGSDQIFGGPGKDRLEGGLGPDDYYFDSANWGNDTIVNEREEGYAYDEWVTFQRVSARLMIDMNSDAGSPEARTAAGGSTVNWSGSRVGALFSGHGDDTITGRDDAISWVNARGGDDFVYVGDGVDDDEVDCGRGFDTVFSDPGDVIASNCEAKNPPTG